MKKRAFLLLLIFSMLLSAFPFHAAAEEPLGTNDAILIMQKLIGLDAELEMERHDRNQDAAITIADAVLVLRSIVDPDAYDESNKLKIVSYNIRYKSDGEGLMIADRAPRLKTLMDELDPDLMGFQEATRLWVETYLIDYFSEEYGYIYQYRSSSSYECTPLFWKKDKFELVESGHFWLSETPNVSSKGWGSKHPRVCSWVKLKIKATGKIFLYYNTHFDFYEECHVGSANLILSHAASEGGFSQYPVIFTADCNMEQDTPGYEVFLDGGMLDINMELEQDTTGTNNGYHTSTATEKIIDFCFYYDQMLVPLTYEVLDEYISGGYISDHKGLYMEMAIRSS